MKHKHCEVIKAWADGAVIQSRMSDCQMWFNNSSPTFEPDYQYRASLAIVEGKPAFEGDVLYSPKGNSMIAERLSGCRLQEGLCSGAIQGYDDASWNPPKPATITVTIPRPDNIFEPPFNSHSIRLNYQNVMSKIVAEKIIKDALT